jgi:two-component system sensor histidine kinase/response regulator
MELLGDAGFRVDLAEDGQVGVDKVGTNDYDLVLMDMQMPVMDGVQATLEIRSDERFGDLPIVAMTANAMAVGREKCIAAGMNDHVAKPIDPEALFKTLLEWIPPGEREPVIEAPSSVATEPASEHEPEVSEPDMVDALSDIDGLDVDGGLKRVVGKRDFYEKLVKDFATGEEAQAVERVQSLLSEGDHEAAERTTHSLKGVAGTLGAEELQSRAAALELAIKEGQSEEAVASHLDTVDEELIRLVAAISDVMGLDEENVETQSTEESLDLSPEVIAKLPELAEKLEAKEGECEQLALTLTINDIEIFAQEVKALGEGYEYPLAVKWGETLEGQAGMFDLDEMSKTLGEYDMLIADLRAWV